MPFTFSHPAIVLPLAYVPKRWISMTGLVAGSISPDFEYFLRLNTMSYYSHTWKGIFWFDLPLAMMITFIFHLVARNELIDNLPPFLTKRLGVFKSFNWIKYFRENYLAVILSIIIGAASHILWDSFTHEDGAFVQKIAELRTSFTIAGYSIPSYKLAQHSSTVVGGFIILLVLLQLPEDNNFQTQRSIVPFWLLICLSVSTITVIRLLAGLGDKPFANLIVTGITGGLVGLLLASFNQKAQYNKE